jgi:murein DD-endopeptidase MepM/ murein hydrolase activator NlpD
MATRPMGARGGLIERIFPERQIYHRSHGQVHFISISAPTQMMFVMLALMLLAWVAYASVNVIFKEQIVSERDRNYRTMVQAYEARIANLRGSVDNLHGALAVARQRFEEELQDLRLRQRQVDELIEQQSAFHEQHNKLRVKVASMGKDIRNDKERRSAVLVDVLSRELEPRISRQARNREAPPVNAVVEVFNRVADARSDVGEALRNDAAQITKMMNQSSQMRSEQLQIVQMLEEETQRKLEELEAIVTRTRVDPDAVAARFVSEIERDREAAAESGQGGPLEPLPEMVLAASAPTSSPFDRQWLRIQNKMERLTALSEALDHMPIMLPLDIYRITSPFGPRRDPFTRRAAFHGGLDFGAPFASPVLATADGVVSYAGRRGAYGRLVEIDHGHGFKTRYAHLHQILVKRGQTVKARQPVGKLGSSGRSTAPHLHYEVWFDKKITDPINFIEAGRYVHKS